jgi:TolB-like protein
MHRPPILSIACTLAILALTSAAEARPSIAILGLEVVEDDATDEGANQLANDLTEALRERASMGNGAYKLAPNSNKSLLEMKLLSDCASEANACMAAIGRELAAERLLYGKVEKRTNGYQVSLKLLDADSGAMEKTTSDVIPSGASPEAIQEWGETLYNRLTGVPEKGTLVIRTNVDKGTVYVDGEVKGSLSAGTARIAGLEDGPHTIAIESPGHQRYDGSVTVSAGGTEEVLVDLLPSGGVVDGGSRPGGVSRVLFWTSLVATAGGAAGITITGLQVRGELEDDKQAALQAVASGGGPRFEGADACDQAESYSGPANVSAVLDACQAGRDRAMLTNIFIGTTIVTALAATYFYYRGYVAPGKAESRERFTITPSLAPNTAGAAVTIEF